MCLDTLRCCLEDVFRTRISENLINELELLRIKYSNKFEYYSESDFLSMIQNELDFIFTEVVNTNNLSYFENKNSETNINYEDSPFPLYDHHIVYENRFDIIAQKSIWDTNCKYGIYGFPLVEKDDNLIGFNVEKSFWLNLEFAYQKISILKKILSVISSNKIEENEQSKLNANLQTTLINSPIFRENMGFKFHNILVELDALDDDFKAKKRKFIPICHSIWKYNKEIETEYRIFTYTTYLKDFINFLNDPKGYDAKIGDESKMSDGTRHYKDVSRVIKKELSKNNPT